MSKFVIETLQIMDGQQLFPILFHIKDVQCFLQHDPTGNSCRVLFNSMGIFLILQKPYSEMKQLFIEFHESQDRIMS